MRSGCPFVLIVLDGWGYNTKTEHNAIYSAKTPHWDEWWQSRPHILLNTSGKSVGLPHGQMGNSEVGHMHIGAGRIIPQDYTRINQAIETGAFDQNKVFNQCIDDLIKSNKALHLMGLLSEGGVHSHEQHLFAFLNLCAKKKFDKVYLHLFLDGRDTPPQNALPSIKGLEEALKPLPGAKIASLSGRYYAMDRDKRWERIQPVYDLLTQAKAPQQYPDAESAIEAYYQQGIYDEFIPPTAINQAPAMSDGDALFFFNFRADRARQLSAAFVDDAFEGFERQKRPQLSAFISMTRYSKNLPTTIAFPPLELNNTLGEILSKKGLSQLRIAETEKYAHVTFFLNGGSEQVFPNEDRILIPSPRIATYDLKPEMSAPELTTTLVNAINGRAFDVIICNFANADMVGHSGKFEAAVKAIECLDDCMNQIWEAVDLLGGQVLITADHGNAEMMYDDKTQQPHTAHTCDPVPLLYLGPAKWHFTQDTGNLTDVAPTILHLLNIQPPDEMTGKILLED